MTNRPLPKPNDRYLHFKGNEYRIFKTTPGYPEHLKEGETITFHEVGTKIDALVCSDIPKDTPIVYYYNANQVFARSLSSFQDVLSDGKPVDPNDKNPGKTMYYRFQKISEL